MTNTYRFRTDAVAGEVTGKSPEDAARILSIHGEWSRIGSREEARDVADGAWLQITDEDGCIVLRRGEVV